MNTDLSDLLETTKHFFWRYHLTIFMVIAASGIALAIFSLIDVVGQSSDTKGYDTQAATSFDQETIDRVKNLNDNPDYTFTLPTNQRTNPFTE